MQVYIGHSTPEYTGMCMYETHAKSIHSEGHTCATHTWIHKSAQKCDAKVHHKSKVKAYILHAQKCTQVQTPMKIQKHAESYRIYVCIPFHSSALINTCMCAEVILKILH